MAETKFPWAEFQLGWIIGFFLGFLAIMGILNLVGVNQEKYCPKQPTCNYTITQPLETSTCTAGECIDMVHRGELSVDYVIKLTPNKGGE